MQSKKLSGNEIRHIMNDGICHSFLGLKFFISPSREESARFAVLTPKRYIKKAVERNYLKRVARHAIREQLRVSKIYDLVCFISSNKISFSYIADNLRDIYAK